MINDLQARESIQAWGLEIKAIKVLDDLVSQCNLIVTTTSAKSPLIRAEQVCKGTHITAMGADDHGKQELQAELLAKADLVVADSVSQCVDHGECFYAVQGGQIEASSILELGHVIKNPASGRTSEDQITVVDLTGVAIQDIQIAKMVDRALRENQKQARQRS
jgi:ornithine cyclodeaminase